MFLQPSGPIKSGQTKTRCETPIFILLCLLVTAALSAAIGCGGLSSAAKSVAPSNQASVSIMPGDATVLSGASLQFTALVNRTSPSGVNWSSTAGSITTNGLFTAPQVSSAASVTVTATIAADNQQNASAKVAVQAPASQICGPPRYLCSRSDTDVIAPAVPPSLGTDLNYHGGHSGAGMVATDPAYGNRILRVTDGNTFKPGWSFNTPSSAETNITSYDETLFLVETEGNAPCLFEFDPTAFAATLRGCYYNRGIGNLQFGYTSADNDAFFTYAGPFLRRFIINRNTWTTSHDPAFNHGKGLFNPDGPQCLHGSLAAEKRQWYVDATALSSDDSTFIASMGPEQDVDRYIVVWNAAKGCRWMNVKTWEVSQGWNTGLANPVKISWVSGKAPTWPGGVHNVQLDRSGAYGVLTINGTSLGNKVFWTIDTNIVNDTCTQCLSHWACDYGVCFWSFGPSTRGFEMRELPILSSGKMSNMAGKPDIVRTPAPNRWTNDQHASHANASPGQKNMYLVALQPNSGGAKVRNTWEDEIIGVSWDGSKRTVRFNKNWNSGFGGFWGSARCPISRQGNYAICNSDYQMYNLDKGFGNGLNQDTCDHKTLNGGKGTNGCRSDILLFELR
jgi:hypothetical protein